MTDAKAIRIAAEKGTPMSPYAKFWVAVVCAVLVAGLTFGMSAMSDGVMTVAEWIQLALVSVVAFGGAAGVYQVKNTPMAFKSKK
jgi:hypothetical protein